MKDNSSSTPETTAIFVTIETNRGRYYLLKVIRRGFDVYCIPPHLGAHFSLHESGESFFRHEGKIAELGEEPPLALIMGEAGIPYKNNIIRDSLRDSGRASSICSTIFSINSLEQDFKKFNREPKKCFVINRNSIPKEAVGIEVGVWSVPDRNKVSFEFNNRDISPSLLYKFVSCEPQIWIYARPF